MSPGSSCEGVKMSTLNTKSVTSGSTERRVAEVNRALRVAIVALDRLRSRREVIVEIGEDHRRVGNQDGLGLLREGALVGERDGADEALGGRIEGRAGIVRRVPDPARLERGGQEYVRHRAVAPVRDVDVSVEPGSVAPT